MPLLLKSESSCYSIDDLKRDKKTAWTGIRNYQARNFMKGAQVGDLCFFYHSGGSEKEPTGIYGVAKVVAKAHADETQFESKNEYYDPKATKEKPIWECIDIAFVEKFKEPITLAQLKRDPKLKGMVVTQKGSRLSVQPVSEAHFKYIQELARK